MKHGHKFLIVNVALLFGSWWFGGLVLASILGHHLVHLVLLTLQLGSHDPPELLLQDLASSFSVENLKGF